MSLDLTGAGATRTTLSMSANALTTSFFFLGVNGRATINQSGGTLTTNHTGFDSTIGHNSNGNGIYNLSGTGALSIARDLFVSFSGTGTFNQTGGTTTIASTLRIGTNGAYNLSGGTLRFDAVTGIERLNYTAGTIKLAANRDLGTDNTIAQLFGSLPTPSSITIPSGKGLHVEGNATLIQPNKTVTVDGGNLTSFNLNAGTFVNSVGTMIVTNGGTVTTTSNATLAQDSGSQGIVTVSGPGSTWNIAGNYTGGIGTAVLNIQDQALVYVGNNLQIGGGSSKINLEGGTLRFNTTSGPINSVILNFTSGTIQLAGNRTLGTDPLIEEHYGTLPAIPTGKGLTVEGTATLSKPLTIDGGKFKSNNLVVGAGGSLDFDRGLLELTGGTITGLASLVMPTNGEFRVSGVQALRVTGAAGSTITATGNLTLGNASAVNGFYTNGTLSVGANCVTLNDANDAAFDSGALVTLGSGASPGTLTAANGLTLDFGGNITGFGTVSTPNNVAKPLINNGHITGTSAGQRITLPGYVKGVGTFDNVNFTGTFSPGFSPASITAGNIAFSPTSTLIIELGGTAAGSQYDQINVTGQLVLDGTLEISLINGFTPSAGQTFDILNWGSLAGAFSSIELPTLPGLSWNTSQLAAGMLSVAIPGDFNLDGSIDAADYVVWRKNPGGIYTPADFNIWRAHFGQTAGSGSGATGSASAPAVPEPATLVVLLVGVLMISCQRRATRAACRSTGALILAALLSWLAKADLLTRRGRPTLLRSAARAARAPAPERSPFSAAVPRSMATGRRRLLAQLRAAPRRRAFSAAPLEV